MSRVEVRPEPGCLEGAQLGEACDAFRDWLAGLALGEAPAPDASSRAAHARRCPSCDAYADDVAACRRWLLQRDPPRPAPTDTAALDRALVVQLRARLARDLLRRARREPARERDAIHDDLDRWRWLARQLGEPLLEVERVAGALEAARPARARLLALAARLDPLGLDIALAWIGWLLHAGRRERADHYADRLANELPERGG